LPASDCAKMRTVCSTLTIGLLSVAACAPLVHGVEALPKVEEIKRGIIARASITGGSELQLNYECRKETISEEFNSNGRLANRKVNVGQTHTVPSGVLSANKYSQRNGISLDEELLHRFEFKLLRREVLNRRPALLLQLSPRKEHASVFQFQERVLNRMGGLVWVDEEDYELVKATFRLTEPVSLGPLGAVEKLDFAFERFRAEDGHWLPQRTETYFKGRKFLKPVQTRRHVKYSEYKKLTESSGSSLSHLRHLR
jgi:hypothetical protein